MSFFQPAPAAPAPVPAVTTPPPPMPSLTLSLAATPQPPQSHPQCEQLYFFYGVADSYGNFAALSSRLLNFNYCYIFHTLRVLHATCCMLQAASCCVVEATTTMWNAKWEMENCENAKCQMGNGAKAVLVSKVIKFQLIDGCVFHCVPQLSLPSTTTFLQLLFSLTFASAVVAFYNVNDKRNEWQKGWTGEEVAQFACVSSAKALRIPIQHSMECNYR